MYILGLGKTMDDVPDIAGELTTWHDHQNLCWDGGHASSASSRQRHVPARGVPRHAADAPRLARRPRPCGPFAGIEGSHGDGCGPHAHD